MSTGGYLAPRLRWAVVLTWVGLGTSPIRAAPFTPHFDPVIAELHARLDDGGLTPKQEKAVSRSLALLDAPSDALPSDLRTAAKVSAKLARAFPIEFDTSSGWGAFVDGIGSLMNDAVQDLHLDVSVARQPLGAAFDALPWDPRGCPARVKVVLNASQTLGIRTFEVENLAKQCRLLIRSLRLIPRGMKVAARCAEKLGVDLPMSSARRAYSSAGTP